MKMWSGLFNIFAIIVIAMLFVVFHNMYTINERQFDEVKVQYASDYATLAALNNAFKVASHQNTSYDDLSPVLISPERVNDVYRDIIRMSYNYSDNEYAKGLIDNSVVVAVICEAWGYRILEEVEYDSNLTDTISGGDYKQAWGVLRPYIVYKNGRVYAANICNNSTKEYLLGQEWEQKRSEASGGGAGDGSVSRILERTDYDADGGTGLNKGDVRLAVAELLSTDINNEIAKRVYTGAYGDVQGLFIPFSESLNAVNNIERPTLLVVLQHSTFLDTGEKSVSYTLSGVSVVPRTPVVGFVFLNTAYGDKNTRYYCYAGQQLSVDGKLLIEGTDYHRLETFDTIEDAANAGYHPHLEFLGNPKNPIG